MLPEWLPGRSPLVHATGALEVLIAAGSTLTQHVDAGALVFGRAHQAAVPGRGAGKIRANKVKRAARKAKEAGQA